MVLDEADEMLSMGFKQDIHYILGYVPVEKSVWLFSATLPEGIQEIIKKFLSKRCQEDRSEQRGRSKCQCHT